MLQATAGCRALLGLQLLSLGLPQVPARLALQLSGACSLAFGPGAALFEALPPRRRPAAPSPSASSIEVQLCGAQVAAVAQILTLMMSNAWQPRGAAAFARTTGKPEVMLPWLLGMCCALQAVTPPGKSGLCCWPAHCRPEAARHAC